MNTIDKTYNGWTNYETWNVKLWIDNDQSSIEYWNECMLNIFENATIDSYFTKKERTVLNLADELKDYFNKNNPLLDAGMYTDLLGAALSEVNWHEIAKSIVEDTLGGM